MSQISHEATPHVDLYRLQLARCAGGGDSVVDHLDRGMDGSVMQILGRLISFDEILTNRLDVLTTFVG